jgi:hypothetical protein
MIIISINLRYNIEDFWNGREAASWRLVKSKVQDLQNVENLGEDSCRIVDIYVKQSARRNEHVETEIYTIQQ